eukprot:CAMPEP_0171168032 /NCGR_PEP_ID=MMETSP0790-20130122/7505_1 /TAXON_ID=2925 /ORGANISM="Alexandrium catenella, Strain OF101" /LENGTH=353 /DNA_ID=CAMNT_0011632867 /DNA_START=100 /DNA_END=1161 /DNA_ORIENTATION=-
MLKARGTVLILACCFISLHSGASLRMVPEYAEPSETAIPKIPKNAAGQVGYLDRLPNLTEFERVWQNRYRSEHRLKEPMPPGVKLVLGIQAVPWQTEFRNVLRRTWLNQTGVCLLGAGPPPSDCSVHVAFVFGSFGQGDRIPEDADLSPSNEAAAREEPGAFVLKGVAEKMNHGKVFEWFRVAVEAFPWATHIAKGDMDMYPFLHKLVKRTSDRACRGPTPYEYAGRAYSCPEGMDCHGNGYGGQFNSSCPPHQCEKVYDSDEERRGPLARHHGQAFAYMGGPLYIMSRKLAEAMVRPDGWYANHIMEDHEDMKASMAIDITAASESFCVSTWNPDAYYHMGEQASKHYANSF